MSLAEQLHRIYTTRGLSFQEKLDELIDVYHRKTVINQLRKFRKTLEKDLLHGGDETLGDNQITNCSHENGEVFISQLLS